LKPGILLMCYTRTLGRRPAREPQEDATGVQRPSKSKPWTSAPLMAPLISSTSCDASADFQKKALALEIPDIPKCETRKTYHKHHYFVTR
jgi:hypothetical protein